MAGSGHAPDAGVSLVGGHPVLDFTNTVAWRTDAAQYTERLTGAAAWVRWAAASGLLTAPQSAALLEATATADPTRVRRELAGLERLRAVLWAVLDALTDGEPPPSGAWQALHRSVLLARENAELPAAFPLRWQPGTARFEDLGHALALRAEELLGGASLPRIRRCEGPGCGWFFLDRSRSGTRRWCSSGDCGNRDRVRRHYTRTRHPQ